MLNTIQSAVLPTVVTFLLGFVAAWRHDFGSKDASILNRMVLVYSVPLALFAGTVMTSRAELSQDLPMFAALCVVIIGLYAAVFLFSRFALHLRMSASALAALVSSAPAVPFVGPGILGDLFGGSSAIPIAIASLVINLTVVPATILFLALDSASVDSQGKSLATQDGEHGLHSPRRPSILSAKLWETIKEPIVWAPVLAFAVVLSGFQTPQPIVHSLLLLGHASGGVALFACGIVLASNKIKINRQVLSFVFLKNIVQPALVLAGLRLFSYRNPIVSEAVLTTAIPSMPIAIMLALRYGISEGDAASTVFLSMIASVITIALFIALTA